MEKLTKAHFNKHIWEMLGRPNHYSVFIEENERALKELYSYKHRDYRDINYIKNQLIIK